MSEWIEQDCRDENHLYVHLKNPELLDLSIFDRLSNDDFCLPCMLTNEKTASMVYAIEGYIPLHDFLSQYVFEKEEGYIFLHQLFEQAIASNRNKPVLFDPDYVFVSSFGDRFAFVVVPIQISNWMFQKWIGRVILDFSNEHTSDYHPCDLVQSIRTSHHLHTLKRF